MRNRYQPRHLSVPVRSSWHDTAHGRVLTTATAAILAGTLAMPNIALAADWIEVGGAENHYDAGTEASGEGWTWDGADNMTLDGYDGGSIAARGTLVIDLVGENTVAVDKEYENNSDSIVNGAGISSGDLTITGEGSLTITEGTDVTEATEGTGLYIDRAEGIYTSGPLTIDGATVNIELDDFAARQSGINSLGDVTIKNGADVTIDVSTEDHATDEDKKWAPNNSSVGIMTGVVGPYLEGPHEICDVIIDDSTVTVRSSGGGIGVTGNLSITDSEVSSASGSRNYAISSDGQMAIDNSVIEATRESEEGTSGIAVRGSQGIELKNVSGYTVVDYEPELQQMDVEAGAQANAPQYLVSEEGGASIISGERTGETPKHILAAEKKASESNTKANENTEKQASDSVNTTAGTTKTASASAPNIAAKSTNTIAMSMPATSDLTNSSHIAALAASAISILGAGLFLHRKNKV